MSNSPEASSLAVLNQKLGELVAQDLENVETDRGELGVYSPEELDEEATGGVGFSDEGYSLYVVTLHTVIREDDTKLSEQEIDALLEKFMVYYSAALAEE